MGWMDNLANTISGKGDGSTLPSSTLNQEYDQRLAILDNFAKQRSINRKKIINTLTKDKLWDNQVSFLIMISNTPTERIAPLIQVLMCKRNKI